MLFTEVAASCAVTVLYCNANSIWARKFASLGKKWMPYTVLHLGESPILHIVHRFTVCTVGKEVIQNGTVGASFPHKAFLRVLWNRDQEEWPFLVNSPFWHTHNTPGMSPGRGMC